MLLIRSFFFWVGLLLAADGAFASNEVIIDVRTKSEYEQGHLAGAQWIDVLQPDFEERVSKLNKNTSYKLYCRSGARSGKALSLMKKLGFKTVENLGSLAEAMGKTKKACEPIGAC